MLSTDNSELKNLDMQTYDFFFFFKPPDICDLGEESLGRAGSSEVSQVNRGTALALF